MDRTSILRRHRRRRDIRPRRVTRSRTIPSPGYVVDPQAPFGRDPATGVPLSDKSAVTAGLLQLFFGVFGIGRFYIDTTQIAVLQLCLGLVGIFFGLFCLVGLPVLLGVAVWAVIDAILMFTGSVKDNFGRKLR